MIKQIIWIDEANDIDFEKVKKIMDNKKETCSDDILNETRLFFIPIEGIEEKTIRENIKRNIASYFPNRYVSEDALNRLCTEIRQAKPRRDIGEEIDSLNKNLEAVIENKSKKDLDVFAAAVLQGMTAGLYSLDYVHGWKPEEIAKECYNIAEAMIAERRKRNA